jgi:hypothetical protein
MPGFDVTRVKPTLTRPDIAVAGLAPSESAKRLTATGAVAAMIRNQAVLKAVAPRSPD